MSAPAFQAPRYVSTRGGGDAVSFGTALLKGLAPDGGLYIPDRIPQIDPSQWRSPESFAVLARRVLERWLATEIPAPNLATLLADALSFPVRLVPLEGGDWNDVFVLELFHGPTLSFKDFGARTMARLTQYFLKDRGRKLTILVATSGDTGSAVADGFAGQQQIQVGLLYPKAQVSPVQEQQLTAVRPGVQAYAVAGTFDDCQRMVKAAFVDTDLSGLRLSSANSINIGRLLPQMLYYIWAVGKGGFSEVTACVPCGNLGNLTGGVLAAMASLPVRRFLAAHNANDAFPRFLAGDSTPFGDSKRTLSNAMDVGAPSNFERLQALLGDAGIHRWISGDRVDDRTTLQSMRRIYQDTGYLADPHTAVGLEMVRRQRVAGKIFGPVVALSTAHPAKFPETVKLALGFEPALPKRLAALWDGRCSAITIPPKFQALKAELLAGSG